MEESDPRTQIHELLTALQSPIADLPTLLSLLTAPLDALGLLPPKFRRYNTRPLPAHSLNVSKHIPQIQRAVLSHIAPTWGAVLRDEFEEGRGGGEALLEQYFCPDAMANARQEAGDVAREAYATLMVSPVLAPGVGTEKNAWTTGFALRVLEKLVVGYPVDRMYRAVFSGTKGKAKGKGNGLEEVGWENCVKDVCMVPAKVANAIAGQGEVPELLENAAYFGRLSTRCEELVWTLAGAKEVDKDAIPALAYLLQKLVNQGVFPPKPPLARSQPSFFQATLPAIRARFELDTPESSSYSKFWSALLLALPSLTLQSILASLFGTLSTIDPPADAERAKRVLVKRDAALLDGLVGKATPPQEGVKGEEERDGERAELWEIATSLILGREWPESYARAFVCWVSGGARGTRVSLKALDVFLEAVVEVWASPEHIKHSLISRHRYMTSLLLVTVSYFPPSSQHVDVLVSMPSFIQAISMYISHLDPSVRRCGMLAAEDVARLCGKKLEFGGWDGQDAISVWAREVRELMKARDVDAKLEVVQREKEEEVEEVAASTVKKGLAENLELPTKATFVEKDGYDSDDSMAGYASPPSSRSASPTPSELAEIEKDPTLNVGVQKVPRPVYLAQLGDLLRAPPKQGTREPHEADKIEMALNCAEELVRKKSGYGTELDENAVNLVYALLGLQDNYELEGFAEKRQGALTALVACAPRKAAPCLIEEFFKNQYSTDQRFVALNALAVGARELASLPVPPSRVPPERTVFPSKMLPGPLHQKYIAAGKTNTELIPLLVDEISKKALDGARASVDNEPTVVRERRLRIQKSSGVTEVTRSLNPFARMQVPLQKPTTKFVDVAAEYFVMPLINRFWAFLRDEQAREERTALFEGRSRYYGAGTGLILNPLVLAQFLRTLAILVNASQNAPEWLAIIAPDSLELAVTIGTRPVSHLELDEDLKDDIDLEEERQKKEASVLMSALELALVVLDNALEIDGGKILGLEHTTLVLGLGEWGGKVFASLEKGLKVQGGGGAHEVKLSQAAAGVLLKVDKLMLKWRQSMLDTR